MTDKPSGFFALNLHSNVFAAQLVASSAGVCKLHVTDLVTLKTEALIF